MLMSRGYLVIIPDYRLYPEVTFWGLLGMPPLPSAGSVGRSLRAAVILVGSLSPVIRLVPIVPHGAIAGPYAFDPSRFSNTRPIFATAHPPAAARLIFFAHAGAPPALLIHSEQDCTVSIRYSEELAKRLRDVGNQVRYVPVADIGHGGLLLGLAEPSQPGSQMVRHITDFVDPLDSRTVPS